MSVSGACRALGLRLCCGSPAQCGSGQTAAMTRSPAAVTRWPQAERGREHGERMDVRGCRDHVGKPGVGSGIFRAGIWQAPSGRPSLSLRASALRAPSRLRRSRRSFGALVTFRLAMREKDGPNTTGVQRLLLRTGRAGPSASYALSIRQGQHTIIRAVTAAANGKDRYFARGEHGSQNAL